jgi:FtsP/CotA-like multicopper oxidase with cupredoxin domain
MDRRTGPPHHPAVRRRELLYKQGATDLGNGARTTRTIERAVPTKGGAAARLADSQWCRSGWPRAPDLDPESAVTRELVLDSREINDQKMGMSRVGETVELGTTEVWEVRNDGGEYHNLHIHDAQFQVLEVGGRPPSRNCPAGRTRSSCPGPDRAPDDGVHRLRRPGQAVDHCMPARSAVGLRSGHGG